MDNGQEWTRTAGDIFLCLSIRPLNVKSIASMMSMMSIRVPVHLKHSFCRLNRLWTPAHAKPFRVVRG
jgi:hypothetical protein